MQLLNSLLKGFHSIRRFYSMCKHLTCVSCVSEDLLKVDGMDMKMSEPITAAHLINAARLGNSKAESVLNKGQRGQTHTHTNRDL